MEFIKRERKHFELKKMNLNEVLNNPDFCSKIRYTGVYSEQNGIRNYVFSFRGRTVTDFYLIPMSQNDFERVDNVRKEFSDKTYQKEQNNKYDENDVIKMKPQTKIKEDQKSLTLEEIMFLFKELGHTFHVDPISDINNYKKAGGIIPCSLIGDSSKNITEMEVLQLIRKVIELERNIEERNLSDFEIIRYIYDEYKTSTAYYDRGPQVNPPNFANYVGLINEHYATCSGLADGLCQLFNYFGFESKLLNTFPPKPDELGHAVTGLYVNDNGTKKVSYIDLSKEISYYWHDSLYNIDGTRKDPPILCRDRNKYEYFLKNEAPQGVSDQKYEGITLVTDRNGNLIKGPDVYASLKNIPDVIEMRHRSDDEKSNNSEPDLTLRSRKKPQELTLVMKSRRNQENNPNKPLELTLVMKSRKNSRKNNLSSKLKVWLKPLLDVFSTGYKVQVESHSTEHENSRSR